MPIKSLLGTSITDAIGLGLTQVTQVVPIVLWGTTIEIYLNKSTLFKKVPLTCTFIVSFLCFLLLHIINITFKKKL